MATPSFEEKLNLLKMAWVTPLLGLGALGVGAGMLARHGFDSGRSGESMGGQSSFEQQGLERLTSGVRDLYNRKNDEMTSNLQNWQSNPDLGALVSNKATIGSGLSDKQQNLMTYGGLGLLGYMALNSGRSGQSMDELTKLVKSRMGN
jgi:hypothetical protein